MELAYDLQSNKTNQLVKREEMQVSIVEKEMAIQIQEKEILRREKELDATVRKPAEAEKQRVQLIADGEQYKIAQTAQGEADGYRFKGMGTADAEKAKGLAQADVSRAQGMAKADVVKATGLAEAEAMEKKAEAWASYNQAAVTQMFIDKLPEIASAISAPLCKMDKIVVINSDSDSAGANRITKDVINIIGQLPPVIESLSGIDLQKLVRNLPGAGLASDREEKVK
jgi:flotillin